MGEVALGVLRCPLRVLEPVSNAVALLLPLLQLGGQRAMLTIVLRLLDASIRVRFPALQIFDSLRASLFQTLLAKAQARGLRKHIA